MHERLARAKAHRLPRLACALDAGERGGRGGRGQRAFLESTGWLASSSSSPTRAIQRPHGYARPLPPPSLPLEKKAGPPLGPHRALANGRACRLGAACEEPRPPASRRRSRGTPCPPDARSRLFQGRGRACLSRPPTETFSDWEKGGLPPEPPAATLAALGSGPAPAGHHPLYGVVGWSRAGGARRLSLCRRKVTGAGPQRASSGSRGEEQVFKESALQEGLGPDSRQIARRRKAARWRWH